MIISYSNLGLDVSSAILSDHPDLWFLSANPFDAILTMSAKTSESTLQSSLDRAAKYVIDALGCTVGNFNKKSYIKLEIKPCGLVQVNLCQKLLFL